jgi:tRNA threonylcarbamoyladenosine biosynthesis protein TsaB
MATILNIETSTEVCSVTIAKDGELLFKKETSEGLSHAELLTVFIEELMAENSFKLNQLDAVAVSKGPGSYTGLRIGVSVAKGLCYGLDIPLIAVNSLEIMGTYAAKHFSQGADKSTLFCPMIDARRMEVYTALYDSQGKEIKPVSAEIIDEHFLADYLNNSKILFFGNGAEKCKTQITHPNAIFKGPEKTSAQFMHKLTEAKCNKKEFENVAYFEPYYLKNFVATISKNKILK